ncbi:hypothetical protein BDZ97DRAFT_1828616 [Flammula alnicola]|nr:hypothetical protein BDZ97DRAFT_1828616 [Flammula alnicola]
MASSESTTNATPAHVIFAPHRDIEIIGKSVFLAGSIDMGSAVDWQSSITKSLQHLPITILNPRRPDWNLGWKQDATFKPFREQVDWELDMLNAADVIALYLDKDSKSPISLLELGLFATSGKLVVACPDGYWRRGNVQIVCERWGVELVDTLEELVKSVERKLEEGEPET